MTEPDLLTVARGDAPADVLLRDGRILNVFTGLIERADIAVFAGRIAGVGPGYAARETVDLHGSFVAPGLIDAHVHIESSLCVPAHFAAAVLPRGVTTVVADPHEIANVAGVAGVRFMADASRGLPLDVKLMAPSCVPATHLATAGAALTAADVAALLSDGTCHGLAEVMNFPGVVAGDAELRAKVAAATGRPVDGHCPGLLGPALNAYVSAGIHTDHESVTVAEAREKLARGLYLLIREATNAHNLDALLPLWTPANGRRICFCTDDRQPTDLLTDGGIDHMVRRAIAFGIDPVEAFRLATLNTAECYGLHDRGAIAPGRRADLMVFDDLHAPVARLVYAAGRSVAGYRATSQAAPPAVVDTCRVALDEIDLRVVARGKRIRVIGSRPDQLLTDHLALDATVVDGHAVADVGRDVLKIAVVERHRCTGNVGLGFIRGVGLRRGAIAGTVAHDHHNLVAVGADDGSMHTAMRAAASEGGGLAVADGDRVLARLPLPVAGLMSDRPVPEVRAGYDALLAAAASLGSTLHDPFMALSFMALEVIPSLKLTDLGLVDVDRFAPVELFVNGG
jgi:adenine deaminase